MKRKWQRQADGFTLLEVMVALAIISFALLTYLHTQNLSIALHNESANMTTATLLAKSRMVALESNQAPEQGEREGTFEDAQYAAFRWKERVEPTLFEVVLEAHVEVTWDDNRGRRSVELISLVVQR
ncbi:MAG: type II secretion system minor pseudopilin GspI [Nitrospinae bacterium]|nr:type II secretion system minor pseudopilin GspI [Nitrospinota bacterium]